VTAELPAGARQSPDAGFEVHVGGRGLQQRTTPDARVQKHQPSNVDHVVPAQGVEKRLQLGVAQQAFSALGT